MKKIRKYLLLTLMLVFALSLIGCSNKDNKETTDKVKNEENIIEEKDSKKEDKNTNNEAKKQDDENQNKDKNSQEKVEEESSDLEYKKIEIDNFDRTLVFDHKPEKIISTSISMGEVLAALNESDQTIGLLKGGVDMENILPEYREQVTKIPDLFEALNVENDGTQMLPSLESMISIQPDLVIVDSFVFNVESFGKPEDYENAGINLYVTESTSVKEPTIGNVYKDIENIGKILNKEDISQEIINSMKDKIESIEDRIKEQEPINVVLYDRIMEGKLFVGAGASLENSLLKIAGCQNMFGEIKEKYSTVSFEDLLDKNPEYLIVYKYSPDQYEATLKELKDNPELSQLKAVQEDKIIPLNFLSTRAGLQNVNLIEDVAHKLFPDSF